MRRRKEEGRGEIEGGEGRIKMEIGEGEEGRVGDRR